MKALEINEEEEVIIHNSVIFMANDLMGEIVELETWIKEHTKRATDQDVEELLEKKRRWGVMVKIAEKVKQ